MEVYTGKYKYPSHMNLADVARSLHERVEMLEEQIQTIVGILDQLEKR